MKKEYTIKSYLSWAQLVMFCLILANGILCIHSHKLANGQIIVHAHPYFPQDNGEPLPYNHTSDELLILAQIFNAPLLQSDLYWFNFVCPVKELSNKNVDYHYTIIANNRTYYLQHRGPPICA